MLGGRAGVLQQPGAPQVGESGLRAHSPQAQQTPPCAESTGVLALTLGSCDTGNGDAFPGEHLGCSSMWLKK